MVFIKLSCPNHPKGDEYECRRFGGGISVQTIKTHDFSKGPITHAWRCWYCGAIVVVTIEGLDKPVRYAVPPEGEQLKTVGDTDVFEFSDIEVKR